MSQPKPGGEGSDVKPPSDPPDSDPPDSGRPLSREEMTMFSPYNSLRSTEPVSQQVEVSSHLDDGDTTEGRARVFFRRMFSGGGATNQMSVPPPTKATNQMSVPPPTKATNQTSIPQTKSTNQSSVPPSKPTNQKASTVAIASRPSPTVNVSKVQSSNPQKTGNNPQATLLVRPARGGTLNPQKQAPQTLGIAPQKPPSRQPPKSAPPNRAPPSTQPQPGVAKWSSNDKVSFKLDSEQLSLTSYTHPRPPPSNHGPSGRGQSMERSGTMDRREVLSRFGNIGKDKEGTDLRKYWMPDKACKDCSDCGVKFSLFIRRHHCRICGRIYCNNCCSLTIPAAELRPNLQGNLRVCKECKNIFREFHSRKPKQDSPLLSSEGQSSDSSNLSPSLSGTMTPIKLQVTSSDPPSPMSMHSSSGERVLKSTSGTLKNTSRPVSMLSPHKSWDEASGRSQEHTDLSPSRHDLYHLTRRSGLAGFDSLTVGQKGESLLNLDEDELEDIATGVWLKLQDPDIGLPRLHHRYRLRNFPDTYSGHELVEWLVVNEHVRSREVAIRVGQALVDTKRLNIVTADPYFREDVNLFLELVEAANSLPDNQEGPLLTDAPKWFQHLRDDEETENQGEMDVTRGFIHVSPTHRRSLAEKGVRVSSIHLEAEKRNSRPTSYTSLGRGELENEDEYLVIDREQSMRAKQDPPYFPTIPSIDQTLSPTRQSFSMIGSEEIVQSLPVDGLSAATEAAKECADEKSKASIPSDKALTHYERVHDDHYHSLMVQQMKSLGLNLKWMEVIKPLIMEATRNVRTDALPDDLMDINQYVKIKKIPRGIRNNCTLVYGVVGTKNVTHKKMLRSIKNPKILLLKCAFEFQRKENQLSSFDTLQLQEEKYLKNLVVKVSTIKPNLILVQSSVSRLALEMLYELGIVVAVNVKPSVMGRVARSTNGEILHSLDQLMFGTASIFGTCGHFYIRTFPLSDGDKKTLMYFDHCPQQLGCVIILQGAPLKELKKVKKVVQFGLHIAHNSILETHFLVDEFAWPKDINKDDPSTPPEDYTSTSSTPEWSLYPSLGYPLKSLSHGELQRKLEALKFVEIDTEDLEVVSELAPTQIEDDSEVVPEQEKQLVVEDETMEKEQLIGTVEIEAPVPSTEQDTPVSVAETMEDQNQTMDVQTPLIGDEVATDTQADVDNVEVKEEPLIQTVARTPYTGIMTGKILDELAEEEFKLAHRSQLLSISPYVKFKTPYLQTPKGRSADSRRYLPNVIYWSYHFKAKNLFKYAQRLELKLDSTTRLEMGLTKSTVQSTVGMESGRDNQSLGLELVPTQPSYKSVSSHPFTSSIFLIQANSSEMKAALADFRSRAGYEDEANTFLFKTAEKASNYHLYLENVFSKCREFELAAAAIEESPASSETEVSMASSGGPEVKSKRDVSKSKSRKSKDPFKKLMPGNIIKKFVKKVVRKVDAIDDDSQQIITEEEICTDSDIVVDDMEAVSQSILLVSTDENGVTVAADIMDSSSTESDDEDFIKERATPKNGDKNRDSGGSRKWPEKFGTLEDFDRSSRGNAETEDDYHGDLNYEAWLAADEQLDCFDPIKHQGISILFSNTSHDGLKHQDPCVPPCVIPMFYYGRNDISLGEFLHRYCFRSSYHCHACGSDMVQHQRHVIHALSAIHINMQKLVSPLPGNDDGVYTWLACKFCDQCTPYTKMSKDSLLFSFAKFLELKFYSETYGTRYQGDQNSACTHSVHKDYVQYFLHKDKLAAFQPDTVDMLDVLVPPRTIHITTPRRRFHLDFKTEIKQVQRIVEGVFYRIGQKLERYRLEPVAHTVDDHIANSKAERDALRSKVRQLKDLVVLGCPFQSGEEAGKDNMKIDHEMEASIIGNLQDNIADLKRCIADLVDCWNINLEDMDSKAREYRRKMREKDSIQGESSRDSPATATPTSSTHSTPLQSIIPSTEPSRSSQGNTPYGTPPGSTHSDSVDLNTVSASNLLAVGGKDSRPPSPDTGAKAHSRNLSDSGLLQSEAMDKTHKRQFSDSVGLQISKHSAGVLSPIETTPLYSSEGGLSSMDAPTTPSGGPSLSELTEEGEIPIIEGETPSNVGVAEEPGVDVPVKEGEIPKKDEEVPNEKSGVEGDVKHENAPTEVPTPKPQSQDIAKSAEREEEVQTDSAGGLLARLRGKETQDSKDDPTKFYLLDPYVITTNSPMSSRSSTQAPSHSTSPSYPDPPLTVKAGKKQAGSQKRSSLAQTESHSEGRGGSEKRLRDKERTGVLSRPFQRLPPPFSNTEHHSMHSIITLPMSIYEKEPTSIIAFALSSREYLRKLKLLQERTAVKLSGASAKVTEVKPAPTASPKPKRHTSDSEKGHPPGANAANIKTNLKAVINELKKKGSGISLFSGSASIQTSPEALETTPDLSKKAELTTSLSVKSYDPSIASSRLSDPSTEGVGPNIGLGGADEMDSGKTTSHVSLEFTSPDKSASFFCKVYYADEFRELRELIFPSGEESFIRSLSRCIKYDAKGGKSRSAFCKVADDRFILKQVKSIEISSFELFAPHYLKHVTKALEDKRPLTLAKILGAYSIGFRNSRTGSSKRLDVLVMENLLYEHSTNKVFDLKGSMRSRFIDPSKESSGDVLLDENYLQSICCNPVYVYPHSKCVLMQAILADTEFLAQNAIMDYSLLTCIDDSTGELVVGIIDYIRTFTLDKRVEMFLKKTAGKTLPTVVYPELYRKRFCEAMDKYFTVVPDKWTGLGADVKY